jgi:hypothetical protein
MRRFKKEFYSYSISERVDNEGDFVEKWFKFCKGCTHHKSKCNYKFNHSVQKKGLIFVQPLVTRF